MTFRESRRYWELRRVWYNVALLALAGAWVGLTWPHFAPALKWVNLMRCLVLAGIANLLYCGVYLVEIPMQASFGLGWRRKRWMLWLAGTLLAMLIACYWIADEIYPYVGLN